MTESLVDRIERDASIYNANPMLHPIFRPDDVLLMVAAVRAALDMYHQDQTISFALAQALDQIDAA